MHACTYRYRYCTCVYCNIPVPRYRYIVAMAIPPYRYRDRYRYRYSVRTRVPGIQYRHVHGPMGTCWDTGTFYVPRTLHVYSSMELFPGKAQWRTARDSMNNNIMARQGNGSERAFGHATRFSHGFQLSKVYRYSSRYHDKQNRPTCTQYCNREKPCNHATSVKAGPELMAPVCVLTIGEKNGSLPGPQYCNRPVPFAPT